VRLKGDDVCKNIFLDNKIPNNSQALWLMLIIPVTLEAEIRMIVVHGACL
jgi:hypothetical protein